MNPFLCAAIVWAVVLWVALSLFGAHGPQDRKQMKLKSGWRPVSEMDRGRGKKR